MAVYQGTQYARVFVIQDTSCDPIDISTWTFESDFRTRVNGEELLNLTTANGGWTVIDGPNGRLQLLITADQSEELPTGKLVFDVLRTDGGDPVWLFGGTVFVKQPVTREDA